MKAMYMQPVIKNDNGEYRIACGTNGLRRLDGRFKPHNRQNQALRKYLGLSEFDKGAAVGFVVAPLDTPLRGKPLVADVDFVLVKD